LNYPEIKKILPKGVNLLAVSKGFQSSDIEYIQSLGQFDFGESKVQEAIQKPVFQINNNLNWHFIGRIQTNKIRKIVEHFDFIHSVDSYKKLLKISEVATELQKTPNVFIQVKLAHDPEKAGLPYSELIEIWDQMKKIKGITITGLMTINPKGLNSEQNFELFNKCRLIADDLDLPDCSMGMSNDWEEAVKAGSTWIRLGSLIFGKRYS
tara:strand:- start:414 stop:1040 length:627 start_codon:yes stop_codon:yes gene_type:complete